MQYDLVVSGAHVIDPANNIDRVTNVAVSDNKIVEVGDAINPTKAAQHINGAGKFLAPGWIDMHVHAYGHISLGNPDSVGVFQGVTMMVDAGGCGAWTYDDCRSYFEGRTKTDIYAMPLYNAAGIYLGDEGALDQEPNMTLALQTADKLDRSEQALVVCQENLAKSKPSGFDLRLLQIEI